jgi:superfamily II DNA or RNA helicase
MTALNRAIFPAPLATDLRPHFSFISPTRPAPARRVFHFLTTHTAMSSFSFRPYQRDDLARAAIHDGAIIAWDPGLGKTVAMFAWPILKRSRFALIVAPAALHAQIIAEGRSKFGLNVQTIADQDDAYRLMRAGILPFSGQTRPANPSGLPTFYITDYRWLGYNGGDEWEDASLDDKEDGQTISDITRRRRQTIIASLFDIDKPTTSPLLDRRDVTAKAHQILGIPADAARSEVKSAFRRQARLTHPDLHPGDPKATIRMQRLNAALEAMLGGSAEQIVKGIDDEVKEAIPQIEAFEAGIGWVRKYPEGHSIRCVFTPSLSTLIGGSFDCAVCDEAVRLKAGVSYNAMGVLNLDVKYRLALTGTPIKNRLPDIFFLAAWACGMHPPGSARFPYGTTLSHKHAFTSNHLVMEENLSKQEESRRKGVFRRYVKQTSQITNVHLLWKLLGPIVLRRRKDSIGEDIVPKTLCPVRVKPGTEQQRVYRWHLGNPPKCKSIVASLGSQLQNLRQAALNPWSPSIGVSGVGASRSTQTWSPKVAACLSLAADLMEKGEQLVVFSPFQEFSTQLKARFDAAGVPVLLLDGRVKNTTRGELAAEFKAGKWPVLIAGIDAMGEGHSFECASHLVLPSLSWAYDANAQAIERVHRLTSKKDVTIYLLVTENTIDERLAAIFQEKGDASDLALDGRLFEDDREEVDLAELLRDAVRDFDPTAATLDEGDLEREWLAVLSPRLRRAASRWTGKPVPPPPTRTRRTRPALHVLPASVIPRILAPQAIKPATQPTLFLPDADEAPAPPKPAPLERSNRPVLALDF